MRKILSGLSLRTLVALMVGALVCAALALAVDEYLDRRLTARQARLVVKACADRARPPLTALQGEVSWRQQGPSP